MEKNKINEINNSSRLFNKSDFKNSRNLNKNKNLDDATSIIRKTKKDAYNYSYFKSKDSDINYKYNLNTYKSHNNINYNDVNKILKSEANIKVISKDNNEILKSINSISSNKKNKIKKSNNLDNKKNIDNDNINKCLSKTNNNNDNNADYANYLDYIQHNFKSNNINNTKSNIFNKITRIKKINNNYDFPLTINDTKFTKKSNRLCRQLNYNDNNNLNNFNNIKNDNVLCYRNYGQNNKNHERLKTSSINKSDEVYNNDNNYNTILIEDKDESNINDSTSKVIKINLENEYEREYSEFNNKNVEICLDRNEENIENENSKKNIDDSNPNVLIDLGQYNDTVSSNNYNNENNIEFNNMNKYSSRSINKSNHLNNNKIDAINKKNTVIKTKNFNYNNYKIYSPNIYKIKRLNKFNNNSKLSSMNNSFSYNPSNCSINSSVLDDDSLIIFGNENNSKNYNINLETKVKNENNNLQLHSRPFKASTSKINKNITNSANIKDNYIIKNLRLENFYNKYQLKLRLLEDNKTDIYKNNLQITSSYYNILKNINNKTYKEKFETYIETKNYIDKKLKNTIENGKISSKSNYCDNLSIENDNQSISILKGNMVDNENKIYKNINRGGKVILGKDTIFNNSKQLLYRNNNVSNNLHTVLIKKHLNKNNNYNFSLKLRSLCSKIIISNWRKWYYLRKAYCIKIQKFYRGYYLRKKLISPLSVYYKFEFVLNAIQNIFSRYYKTLAFYKLLGKDIELLNKIIKKYNTNNRHNLIECNYIKKKIFKSNYVVSYVSNKNQEKSLSNNNSKISFKDSFKIINNFEFCIDANIYPKIHPFERNLENLSIQLINNWSLNKTSEYLSTNNKEIQTDFLLSIGNKSTDYFLQNIENIEFISDNKDKLNNLFDNNVSEIGYLNYSKNFSITSQIEFTQCAISNYFKVLNKFDIYVNNFEILRENNHKKIIDSSMNIDRTIEHSVLTNNNNNIHLSVQNINIKYEFFKTSTFIKKVLPIKFTKKNKILNVLTNYRFKLRDFNNNYHNYNTTLNVLKLDNKCLIFKNAFMLSNLIFENKIVFLQRYIKRRAQIKLLTSNSNEVISNNKDLSNIYEYKINQQNNIYCNYIKSRVNKQVSAILYTKLSYMSYSFNINKLINCYYEFKKNAINHQKLRIKSRFILHKLNDCVFTKISKLSNNNIFNNSSKLILDLLNNIIHNKTLFNKKVKNLFKLSKTYKNLLFKKHVKRYFLIWYKELLNNSIKDNLNKQQVIKKQDEFNKLKSMYYAKTLQNKIIRQVKPKVSICYKEIRPYLYNTVDKITDILRYNAEIKIQNRKNFKKGVKLMANTLLLNKAQDLIYILKNNFYKLKFYNKIKNIFKRLLLFNEFCKINNLKKTLYKWINTTKIIREELIKKKHINNLKYDKLQLFSDLLNFKYKLRFVQLLKSNSSLHKYKVEINKKLKKIIICSNIKLIKINLYKWRFNILLVRIINILYIYYYRKLKKVEI